MDCLQNHVTFDYFWLKLMIISVGLPGSIFVSWLPVLSWRQLEKYCLCSVDKSPVCRCIFRKYIDMVKSWNTGVESRMNFHVDFCICLPQPKPHRPKHITKPVIVVSTGMSFLSFSVRQAIYLSQIVLGLSKTVSGLPGVKSEYIFLCVWLVE